MAPGLCSTYEGGSILSDRVAYRLQQFFEVKYTNILTIMSIALQSFQILHEEYGLFNVKRGMIGIAGNLTAPRVKVWCNQDFSNP